MNSGSILLIPLSLFLLLFPPCLLGKLNLNREVRYKQLRMPLAALLLTVCCCAFPEKLSELAEELVDTDVIQDFLDLISPSGLRTYTELVYTIILSNVLVFSAFFIIKLIARIGLNKRIWPADPIGLGPAGAVWYAGVSRFYRQFRGRVTLRRSMVGVEYVLRYAVWIVAALYLLLDVVMHLPLLGITLISTAFLESSTEVLYLIPAVTLVFVNEFRWFLGGAREFDRPKQTIYDDSEIRRVDDFSELAEQYKRQFPERFCKELDSKPVGSSAPFYNDAPADNERERAIAEQLRTGGYIVNRNFITCLECLFRRVNALVNASIFSDFGEYLFIYLNTLLARGENVLFVCADEGSADALHRYIADRFRRVNNYHQIWLIKNEDDVHGTSDADVLIMTPQFVLDPNVFVGQEQFFARLSVVILVNASEIIARDSVVMTLLAHRLTALDGRENQGPMQYICLSDSIHPETSNALKQILDLQEELYVCDAYQAFAKTRVMLWNYEAARSLPGGKDTLAQDNLFGSSSQTYWGVGLPMACVALKYGVERINIIARAGTPYLQIVSSIKNQMSRITGYFGPEIGSGDFDRVIRFNHVESKDPRSMFIIVEDDLFNLPLAIYNYCRFGGTESGMIHIISKPYMLRDYFAADAERYVSDEARVDMIMPALSDTRQIILTKILSEVLGPGIEADALLARVRSIDPCIKDLHEALRFCRDAFFRDHTDDPVEYTFYQQEESEFSREKVSFRYKTLIHMKRDAPLAQLVMDAKLARMELRGRFENLGLFANRIRQSFVVGQSFVHNGCIYRVTQLDDQNGIVHVTEAADRLISPVDYIQVRKYALTGEPTDTDVYPVRYSGEKYMTDGYEIRLYHGVNVSVDTLGYFSQSSVNPALDLQNGPDYHPFSGAERLSCQREYRDTTVLAFRIKNVGERMADRTSFLLAVMMNELLKTVFPYSYQCIAVCPNLSDPAPLMEKTLSQRIASAYPQITVTDAFLHEPDDVEVILVEDCASDLGLLRTLLQNEVYPFSFFFNSILAYLNWYYRFSGSGNINNRYLHFGAEDMPDCFDPETLAEICNEFETVRRSDSISVELVNTKGCCTYCHRELVNVSYVEMQDGAGKYNRKLCDRCARLIVRDKAQLTELYNQTRQYLCSTFGITLPEDITVRFATAATLRKRVRSGDKRVVVGLSDIAARELWVESDAPAANVLDVLVHELTHFWQAENLQTKDTVYLEGQCCFVEVQYMRSENYAEFAEWLDANLRRRRDVYGKGYRLLCNELKNAQEQNSFAYMVSRFGSEQG